MPIQTMKFTVATGSVILQWPDDIDPDCLEFAAEALAIQVANIRRRAIYRKAGETEYASWFAQLGKP